MLSPTFSFISYKKLPGKHLIIIKKDKGYSCPHYVITGFNTGISETPGCFAAKMSFIENTDSSWPCTFPAVSEPVFPLNQKNYMLIP